MIGEGIVSLMTAYYVMSRVGYVVVVVNTENEECTNSAYPAPSILSFGSIPLRCAQAHKLDKIGRDAYRCTPKQAL